MGEVKLLPCPFCGGNKIDGMFIRDGWRVGCMECGGGVQAYHPEAHKRAAEKWNRRDLDAAKDAEIDKLREENDRLREALDGAAGKLEALLFDGPDHPIVAKARAALSKATGSLHEGERG